MISISILITLSALAGFGAGSFFRWSALVVTGAWLAPLAAFALQRHDFTAVSGISIIVACLAINQAAYVIAIRLNDDQGGNGDHLPQQGLDDIPDDDRNDEIRGEHKRDKPTSILPNSPSGGGATWPFKGRAFRSLEYFCVRRLITVLGRLREANGSAQADIRIAERCSKANRVPVHRPYNANPPILGAVWSGPCASGLRGIRRINGLRHGALAPLGQRLRVLIGDHPRWFGVKEATRRTGSVGAWRAAQMTQVLGRCERASAS
jgi:hypothetical protein